MNITTVGVTDGRETPRFRKPERALEVNEKGS